MESNIISDKPLIINKTITGTIKPGVKGCVMLLPKTLQEINLGKNPNKEKMRNFLCCKSPLPYNRLTKPTGTNGANRRRNKVNGRLKTFALLIPLTFPSLIKTSRVLPQPNLRPHWNFVVINIKKPITLTVTATGIERTNAEPANRTENGIIGIKLLIRKRNSTVKTAANLSSPAINC